VGIWLIPATVQHAQQLLAGLPAAKSADSSSCMALRKSVAAGLEHPRKAKSLPLLLGLRTSKHGNGMRSQPLTMQARGPTVLRKELFDCALVAPAGWWPCAADALRKLRLGP
jgi:hypothetical protein